MGCVVHAKMICRATSGGWTYTNGYFVSVHPFGMLEKGGRSECYTGEAARSHQSTAV